MYDEIRRELGEQKMHEDRNLDDMLFQTQRTSAKLAGALNSAADSAPPPPGFIIAQLKRALIPLEEALGAAHAAEKAGMLPQAIAAYRVELLHVRSAMIDLMEKYRRRLRF